MKNIIIIASISIIVIIIFLTSIIMAVNKTEEQKYTLILKENDFDKNVHTSWCPSLVVFGAKHYLSLLVNRNFS